MKKILILILSITLISGCVRTQYPMVSKMHLKNMKDAQTQASRGIKSSKIDNMDCHSYPIDRNVGRLDDSKFKKKSKSLNKIKKWQKMK